MNLATRQAEQQPPSYDDFEILKECFLEVLHEPDVQVRQFRDSGLWFKLERLMADCDLWSWPLTSVCVTGLIKTIGGGNVMAVRYRELTHHDDTVNSSVNHDYILAASDGEVTRSVQSIRGCPDLPSPKPDLSLGLGEMRQAAEGAKILENSLGGGLILTAGDCGVLFDRLATIVS